MGLVDSIKRAAGSTTPDRRLSVSDASSSASTPRRASDAASRKSVEQKDVPPDGADTEVLDDDQGNVLLALIGQRQSLPDLFPTAAREELRGGAKEG